MNQKVLAYDFSVLENPLFTGVERYAASLLKHLPQLWPERKLVGLWRRNLSSVLSSQAQGWENRVDNSILPRSLWRRARLGKMAQQCQADVLVSPVAHVPILKGLVSCRTVHDLPAGFVGSFESRTWRQRFADWSWQRQDVPTIFPSAGTQNAFTCLLPHFRAPRVAISHGVDDELLRQPLVESDRSNRLIVVVGTVRPRRRPEVVEEALCTLLTTDPNAAVRWIGSLPEGRISDSRIDFLGPVDDPEKVREIARASCVLCPSVIEGFGIPLLEGLALGKPVVSAQHPAGMEVGGDQVQFYNGNSANDLVRAIRTTWSQRDSLTFSQKRRDHAKQFTWMKSAKEHVQFFESILKY